MFVEIPEYSFKFFLNMKTLDEINHIRVYHKHTLNFSIIQLCNLLNTEPRCLV